VLGNQLQQEVKGPLEVAEMERKGGGRALPFGQNDLSHGGNILEVELACVLAPPYCPAHGKSFFAGFSLRR